MNKKNIFEIILIIILIAILGTMIYFYINEENSQSNEIQSSDRGVPPDKPDENGGMTGNDNSSNVSHTGATEISTDTTNSGNSYTSTTGSQNALLVTGGTSTLTNLSVTKSGDSDGDNSDFYGTNAAVLVKEGTLNIKGGTVTTNGSHANGVFAYSKGIINNSETYKNIFLYQCQEIIVQMSHILEQQKYLQILQIVAVHTLLPLAHKMHY